jgi:hypothetical protein
MDWLIGTQFNLLMYLKMKADLKLLVRSIFMQFWDCRKKMRVRKKRMEGGGAGCSVQNESDDSAAAIHIFQQLSEERQLFDRNNPVMKSGSVYPSMKELRLAMRQYAIDKEFELSIYNTSCYGNPN